MLTLIPALKRRAKVIATLRVELESSGPSKGENMRIIRRVQRASFASQSDE